MKLQDSHNLKRKHSIDVKRRSCLKSSEVDLLAVNNDDRNKERVPVFPELDNGASSLVEHVLNMPPIDYKEEIRSEKVYQQTTVDTQSS